MGPAGNACPGCICLTVATARGLARGGRRWVKTRRRTCAGYGSRISGTDIVVICRLRGPADLWVASQPPAAGSAASAFLAQSAGLQVLAAMMEADLTAVAGPRGRHDSGRTAFRHGPEAGSVTLGGRRIPVERPRARTAGGSAELPVAATSCSAAPKSWAGWRWRRRSPGCRRAVTGTVGLEPVGQQVSAPAQHEQVGGLAPVCRQHRERPGRTAGRGPVRAGPGRVHGRRDALRETCCGVALGITIDETKVPLFSGEHHAGHRADRRAARARPGRDPADLRLPGRRQGAAPGGRRRVRTRRSPKGHHVAARTPLRDKLPTTRPRTRQGDRPSECVRPARPGAAAG